jgi:HEXXH motif-containing protein
MATTETGEAGQRQLHEPSNRRQAGDKGDSSGEPRHYEEAPLWVHLGHLSCLAASAAIRPRTDVELTVPVCQGCVFLPGLGRAQVPARTTGSGSRLQRPDLDDAEGDRARSRRDELHRLGQRGRLDHLLRGRLP